MSAMSIGCICSFCTFQANGRSGDQFAVMDMTCAGEHTAGSCDDAASQHVR